MSLADSLRSRIQSLVTSHRVVLFMKGNRQFPQCGFSARVVEILNDVVGTYETVNVLADPELRDGIKEFASWPTIPQLFVGGNFVGGCDIVKEMYESGELQRILGEGAPPAPRVTLSARATIEIRKAASDVDGERLRLTVSAGFENELYFDAEKEGDFIVSCGATAILVDAASERRADGVSIDYVDRPNGAGFRIDNPNEPPRVRPITAADLKQRLSEGDPVHLFDVRPEVERRLARIDAAHSFDAGGVEELAALPKDALIVFHCHHGIRSRAAAEEAVRRGFRRVYNLEGGIEAWSQDVDPQVPHY